jgi:hypothetical protein
MREFFHGWRQKAGVVTLVITLALAALWCRSYAELDRFWIHLPTSSHVIYSVRGATGWAIQGARPEEPFVSWEHESASPFTEPYRYWKFNSESWEIVDWILVCPLTLLSAYLIVWKPRKQQPTASKPHA